MYKVALVAVKLSTMAHARLEDLTREDIIRVSKKIAPKRIQKWSVVIGNKEFPVKQILMEAANGVNSPAPRVTPADFITHYAVSRLRRLGFNVRYAE
jgi:hypothetical protein